MSNKSNKNVSNDETVRVDKKIKDDDSKKSEKNRIIKAIKEIVPYVVILVVVVIIRTYFFTPIIVNGESMSPTLDGGELMILNKRSEINRFDVVVVDIGTEEIIKRVIAMPGETIACENGVVFVNGRRQDEDYSKGVTSDFNKVTLGDDEYFVMGDNRENSADSRVFGAFTSKQIKGATSLVLFPFSKFGNIS